MAMLGWDGADKEVTGSMHAGQSHEDWSHVGRCRSIHRVRGDTLVTHDHTAVQVRISR